MTRLTGVTRTGPGCEPIADGLLAEPVSAVTSLAFVVGALVLLALAPRRTAAVLTWAALVAGIGIGSVVQHGPAPSWADLVHDLPLAATLALVAADSSADLLDRARVWWWWVLPVLALAPVIVAAPLTADLLQVGLAVVATALTALRALLRPGVRRQLLTALVLLAVGGSVGSLSRAGGPLCVPESLWQGHAVWHVLAATALVVLAPVMTDPGRPQADDDRTLARRGAPTEHVVDAAPGPEDA